MSAGEIATALSKSAVSARLAGMSMDELIASVSVIGEVTQNSMDSVGVAMKSLLARYGNVKAGVFSSMGLDDDGETTENINDIEKVLGKLGIRVRSSSLEMRSLSDVLDELNEKWSTYDTVTKNAIATAFGGTRQRENFLVLMENYDRYKELTEESANAAGTADKKYEAYMDSMEAATKRLTNAWEEFTLKLKSSTIMKEGIKLLALFVENMDKLLAAMRILAPIIFSNKIKNFFANTGVKAGELFGRAKTHLGFSPTKTTFTRNDKGQLVAEFGEKGVAKAGFDQLHEDLVKLINVTTGEAVSNGQVLGRKTVKVNDTTNAEWDPVSKRWRGRDSKTGKYVKLSDEDKSKLTAIQEETQGVGIAGIGKNIKGKTQLVLSDGTVLTRGKRGSWHSNTITLSTGETATKAGILGHWYDAETDERITDKTKLKELKEAYKKNVQLTPEQQKEFDAIKRARAKDLAVRSISGAILGIGTGLMVGYGQKSYAGGNTAGANRAKSFFGIKSGDQQVESKGASAAKGIAAGAGAFVSMLPSPWNSIGPVISMLGPLLTDFVSTWIHRDELERKERSEQAQKQLDALNGIQSTIEDSADLISKDVWVSDDYKAFKEYIDGLNQSYLDMESDFAGATDTFIANFNEVAGKLKIGISKIGNINDLYDQLADANIEVRKKAQRAIELANLQAQREQYVKSQEATNYDYYKKIGGVTKEDIAVLKDVASGTASEKRLSEIATKYNIDLTELKSYSGNLGQYSDIINNIEEAFKGLEENQKAIREMDTEIGILAADIWEFSDDQLNALTMDGVMGKVAAAMKVQGVEVRNAAGYIKDEYASAIKAAIKSNSEFSTLLKGDTRTMSELVDAAKKFTEVFGKNASYTNLKDKLDRGESINWEGSGYTDKQLALLVYAANPEQQQLFANAWNTNIEGAKKLAERFKDLSTAEGLLSTTEVVDKYSKLNDIFEDLSDNSRLTVENYAKMIEEYPQLISGAGSLTDLYDKIVNQQAFSLGNAMYNRIMTEASVGNQFKKQFKDQIAGLGDDVAKALGDNGITLTNILEKAQSYESAGETAKAEGLRKLVQEYFNQIPELEFNNPVLEKVIEYQEKLWEKQISNLEEQKEALSKVNEEREKELNLMKAQEQLENARKEKKMVYREGVGFVYEADESAISEAQKNLEDLDTQKRQDEIQAEIDRLNYFKETMDALKDDQVMAALKKNFDTYTSSLAENRKSLGSNTEAVLKLADALNNQKIKFEYDKDGNFNITLPDGSTESLNSQKNIAENTTKQLEALSNAKTTLSDAKANISKYTAGTTDYSAAVSRYNTALSAYNTAKTALGDKASGNEKYQNIVADDSSYEKMEDAGYVLYPNAISQPPKDAKKKGWAYDSWSHENGLKLSNTAAMGKPGDFDDHPEYSSVKKYQGNNTWGEWKALEGDWKALPNYSIVANEMHNDEYNFVLDGALRKLIDAKTNDNASNYAFGTLGKPTSGLSYINELGTEAIITPSGTLTALPSKTGIIPADITKNLWGLGEVAPNLVGMLDSLKQQRFDTEAKTITNEEGVYIDRLDMSIYPKEGYNMDEFISQLRAKAALTRQNN